MKYRAFAAVFLLAGCSCQPSTNTRVEQVKPPAVFTPDRATVGVISGKVALRGRAPAREPIRIDEDLACVQLNPQGMRTETVLAGADGAVANVFVYVKSGLEGKTFAPPPPTATVTIDQRNCRFAPRMIGIRTGQTLRVTNSDPVTHNIHPQPKQNRDWNQSQAEGAPALERRFVRPEMMVRVKCNVHSWMRAYINVMEHPYFAVTGPDGSFEIKDLPPGDYTLETLQEKLPPQEIKVHLDPAGHQSISFTLSGEQP